MRHWSAHLLANFHRKKWAIHAVSMVRPRPGTKKCAPIMTPRTRFGHFFQTLYMYVCMYVCYIYMYIYICRRCTGRIFWPIFMKLGKNVSFIKFSVKFVNQKNRNTGSPLLGGKTSKKEVFNFSKIHFSSNFDEI